MPAKKTLPNLTLSTPDDSDAKNQTWEMNHARLTYAIQTLIDRDGIMPPVQIIAEEAGLSRQTVYEHLRDFNQSTLYQNQIQAYRMLGAQVLATLSQLALRGDVKAAKVFLGAIGGLTGSEPATSNPSTTNYIQVNNSLKIDQLTFLSLPPCIQQQISDLIQLGINNQSKTN